MNDSFKKMIDDAKGVLVLIPTDPTFDSAASATSLYLALKQNEGKEVNLYCPAQMIVEFNKLVGINKVRSEIGNKNLSVSFANYNPQGIEKVSWDIDDGTFKLTVVPKTNVAPPNQDQVIVSYTGVAADLVIMVGGSGEESFQVVKSDDLKDAKLAHVGTNPLNINGKTILSFASAGSSISEVVANIIKGSGYNMDGDLATNLLMGIEKATNQFSVDGVSADTFALVSDLMKAGGKRESQMAVAPVSGYVQEAGTNAPSSWTEPKIFKGTSVN